MAIRTVRQLLPVEMTETKGEKGSIQYTGKFHLLVISDTPYPAFGDIATDTNTYAEFANRRIPQINDLELVGGREFRVTSRQFAYHEENEYSVKVTINLDAKPAEDIDEQDNPSDEARTWLKISMSSLQERRPASESLDDNDDMRIKPPLNSALDPVDGLEEETALVRLTYTNTNVTNPDFPQLLLYINTCNETDFLGAKPYTLRVTGFGADFDQKNRVWTVSVEWTYNPRDWKLRYYDVGYNEIVDGERRAILDKSGNPVSKPVALNNDGTAKAVGEEPDILTILPYEKLDHSIMLRACGLL